MRLAISKLMHRPCYNRVQILSDLHLEIGQQYASYTFPVTAPYLLLAGDIGRLVDHDNYLIFLEAQTARYEVVLLVCWATTSFTASATPTPPKPRGASLQSPHSGSVSCSCTALVANQRGYVFPQAAGASHSKRRENRMAIGGFDPGKVVIG
ncbi:hypothetical protein MY11210_004504 [Beauveria gryllotalpidicola]